MKLSNRAERKTWYAKPAGNQAKRNVLLVLTIIITAALIVWVINIGKKAEETIDVCILAEDVYKNEVITEEMFERYSMLLGEYEKYALVNENGKTSRRILLWSERDKVINAFAAYPLQKGTYAEYRDFIKSRTDNRDNVLYSYPGKDIVPLSIQSEALNAFKAYLQPGDTINIEAIFTERVYVTTESSEYGVQKEPIDVVKTEKIFTDLMIADLLNSTGESILDIYAEYNNATVYEQAKMDASEDFQRRVEPSTLLVAFTPDEKERYYYYSSKDNIQFKVSLPQRTR